MQAPSAIASEILISACHDAATPRLSDLVAGLKGLAVSAVGPLSSRDSGFDCPRRLLDCCRSRAKDRQNPHSGQAEDEASNIGDRIARITVATGNKRLKPFHGDAIRQHRKDCDRRKFTAGDQTEAEHRGRKRNKYEGMQQQITDTAHPVQRRVTNHHKRIRRQQSPRHGSELTRAQEQMRGIPNERRRS